MQHCAAINTKSAALLAYGKIWPTSTISNCLERIDNQTSAPKCARNVSPTFVTILAVQRRQPIFHRTVRCHISADHLKWRRMPLSSDDKPLHLSPNLALFKSNNPSPTGEHRPIALDHDWLPLQYPSAPWGCIPTRVGELGVHWDPCSP